MFGGGFDTPEQCRAHEAKCNYNPASRTCATCRHHDWPKTPEQWDKWGHYEDDGEFVNDFGCLVFNDQTWREGCEKWEAKKRPWTNQP